MKIAKMTLKKYRNYDNLEVSFNDNLNIIIFWRQFWVCSYYGT